MTKKNGQGRLTKKNGTMAFQDDNDNNGNNENNNNKNNKKCIVDSLKYVPLNCVGSRPVSK
jgi:hypothetical protein